MNLRCEAWGPENETLARAFLEERFATSMFLLSNLAGFGPRLGEAPNSGNFKIILSGGRRVLAVFCLARRGNLVVSGDSSPEIAAMILKACREESVPLKGVIGAWEIAEAVWKEFHAPTCSFHSKEILYRLREFSGPAADPDVRFLGDGDFIQWRSLRKAFNEEENLKHDLSEEQLKENFARYSRAQEFWGLFEGDRMVATTALNAVALDIGQVGGVYTVPDQRGRGLCQRVMRQMLADCERVHGLKRMILFTGETNVAAQRVYEKLGFERIGHFGIFFV